MEIIKGYQFRLYPNKAQRILIAQTLGCSRFVYNRFLDMRSKAYTESKTSISYTACSHLLTELKKELDWLKQADSMALQESLRDLDNAFQAFFRKQNRYPVFHSKHNQNQSYRTRNQGNGIRFVGHCIHLPKLGYVKVRQSRPVRGTILNATIRKTASNRYYVSLCVQEEMELLPNNGGQIGLDVGIKAFYTDSNGQTVENPKYLRKAEKKLARLQRKLSRKQIGSRNRQKQRLQVARLHEHIANQRKDFLHKQTTMLVRENQTICVEHLRVKNMLRNHKLAKAITDVSWGMFFRLLEYKAVWYGCEVRKIDTFYPSSQICFACGYQNPNLKYLNIRTWVCPQCRAVHDRDKNASDNILAKGLQLA